MKYIQAVIYWDIVAFASKITQKLFQRNQSPRVGEWFFMGLTKLFDEFLRAS